jgi:multicomponent Na+:H+ antiporter subunit F
MEAMRQMEAMSVVFGAVTVLLGAAALGAIWRIIKGPSILDRMIGSEVLLVTVMAAMLAEMAYHQHTRTLPVVLVVVTLGFTGSVSVARYVSSAKDSR